MQVCTDTIFDLLEKFKDFFTYFTEPSKIFLTFFLTIILFFYFFIYFEYPEILGKHIYFKF